MSLSPFDPAFLLRRRFLVDTGMGLGAISGQTVARRCHRALTEVEQQRLDLLHADRLREA